MADFDETELEQVPVAANPICGHPRPESCIKNNDTRLRSLKRGVAFWCPVCGAVGSTEGWIAPFSAELAEPEVLCEPPVYNALENARPEGEDSIG